MGSNFSYDFGFFQLQNNINFTKGRSNTYALFTGDNPQTVGAPISPDARAPSAMPTVARR